MSFDHGAIFLYLVAQALLIDWVTEVKTLFQIQDTMPSYILTLIYILSFQIIKLLVSQFEPYMCPYAHIPYFHFLFWMFDICFITFFLIYQQNLDGAFILSTLILCARKLIQFSPIGRHFQMKIKTYLTKNLFQIEEDGPQREAEDRNFYLGVADIAFSQFAIVLIASMSIILTCMDYSLPYAHWVGAKVGGKNIQALKNVLLSTLIVLSAEFLTFLILIFFLRRQRETWLQLKFIIHRVLFKHKLYFICISCFIVIRNISNI